MLPVYVACKCMQPGLRVYVSVYVCASWAVKVGGTVSCVCVCVCVCVCLFVGEERGRKTRKKETFFSYFSFFHKTVAGRLSRTPRVIVGSNSRPSLPGCSKPVRATCRPNAVVLSFAAAISER